MKKKFIIVEGGEGSGKSTIVKYVAEKLRKSDIDVLATREPGGSKVAEAIRKAFINDKLEPVSQLFCFLAARAVWVEQILAPALKKGRVVLSDRSFPTTYSYQGIVGGIGLERVKKLNMVAMRSIKPDLVIILDIDAQTGLRRSSDTGDTNAFEKESIDFHTKANAAYLELAKNYHWKIIDARQPLSTVKKQVYSIVSGLVKEGN